MKMVAINQIVLVLMLIIACFYIRKAIKQSEEIKKTIEGCTLFCKVDGVNRRVDK